MRTVEEVNSEDYHARDNQLRRFLQAGNIQDTQQDAKRSNHHQHGWFWPSVEHVFSSSFANWPNLSTPSTCLTSLVAWNSGTCSPSAFRTG